MSLRGRLTVFVSLTLLAAVAVQGAIAYQAARRVTIAASQTRLQSVASRLADLAGPSTRGRLVELGQLATVPAVLRALADSGARSAVRPLLQRLGPDTGLVAAVQLLDRDGRPVAFLQHAASPEPGLTRASGDSAYVSRLYQRGDSLLFDLVAPVTHDGTVRGYLVQVRRLVASAASVQTLTNFIGAEAGLLLGNADGSLWTDLTRVVERPAPTLRGSTYFRDGRDRIAASAAIAGTPLVFAVELPRDLVLSAVSPLFRTDLVIAALVVLLGTLASWWVARTVAQPLSWLTDATEVVASGHDLQVRLPTGRRDEIGRLARSFTTMAGAVREGRATLEHRVADRTAELAAALERLRAAQSELVQKERLAILGQLSSSVGHELRNPLGVMTNAVYYLAATQPDAKPKVKEYLGIIRTQIQTAEKIVADLLDFARVRPPQRAPTAVPAFVEEHLSRVTMPPTVSVVQELAPDLPRLDVDPIQVGQVVLNLITNAVQAMEETGGTLTIRAAAEGATVRLEFEDTGPGVADEHLGRIFEPLFTTKARGIGLGLSVSRSLARANDGDLTVRNASDRGAIFSLVLPAMEAG